MSDNLGTNQTRVIDPQDKSYESVTYQNRKPPLSSEFNLGGNLESRHAQGVAQQVSPSGWAIVGNLKNEIDESSCRVGDILTSSSFNANTLKLIAYDKGILTGKLIAWVNGWKVVVQGSSNASDQNNIITLPAPPTIGHRLDFVFLEVWRKLIQPEDVVYKYGNILYGGTNPTNDCIDCTIGIETSLRIQLQYRIRVAQSDLENYPSGFDPNYVFVQGPLLTPISTCSSAYFSPVPGDIGLWRAGAGDSAASEILETVDGYTYAIPMFAVHRRNTDNYDPDSRSNGAGKSLVNYLAGVASDRPDNQYNDWIVSNDIYDMRHRIGSDNNMKELCETSFQKLCHGDLRGKLEKVTIGEDHFGTVITQADAVSPIDKAGSTFITTGDGIRRVFSNALLSQSDTLVQKTISNKTVGLPGVWAINDEVQIYTTGYPVGSVLTSIDEIYSASGVETNYTVTGTGTNTIIIRLDAGFTLLGSTTPFIVDYTIQFINGPHGMTHLPEQFLEFRREDSTSSIASQEANIRVRQAAPVIAADGTHFNMLSNNGGNTTEPFDFGHQMTYNILGNGTTSIPIPRYIDGYEVLGILSIWDGSIYRDTSDITRTASIYSVSMGSPAVGVTTNLECQLYLRNKFFETNRQARAITDTFEMKELTTTGNNSDTVFTLDTTNQQVIAIGSSYLNNGLGLAYVDGTQKTLITSNAGLPTDTTKSMVTINFGAYVPSAGSSIEVPLLMKSAITASEGYTFFYERIPYQGQLDSTVVGVIEGEGPALTTTAGSGMIRNFTYSVGNAVFADSTAVEGIGTAWLTGTNIEGGFVINANSQPDKKFVISSVYNDTSLIITGRPDFISNPLTGETYTITGEDVPFFNLANIIDRLPAYDSDNDGAAKNEDISTAVTEAYPVLNTRVISRVQDFIDLIPNDATIGVSPGDRGRYTVKMIDEMAPMGLHNLGIKFEKLDSSGEYQKTYQAYTFNRENEGRLFLMVVGSETGSDSTSRIFNENSTLDSVDIFEMPGRPLTARRTM